MPKIESQGVKHIFGMMKVKALVTVRKKTRRKRGLKCFDWALAFEYRDRNERAFQYTKSDSTNLSYNTEVNETYDKCQYSRLRHIRPSSRAVHKMFHVWDTLEAFVRK